MAKRKSLRIDHPLLIGLGAEILLIFIFLFYRLCGLDLLSHSGVRYFRKGLHLAQRNTRGDFVGARQVFILALLAVTAELVFLSGEGCLLWPCSLRRWRLVFDSERLVFSLNLAHLIHVNTLI